MEWAPLATMDQLGSVRWAGVCPRVPQRGCSGDGNLHPRHDTRSSPSPPGSLGALRVYGVLNLPLWLPQLITRFSCRLSFCIMKNDI